MENPLKDDSMTESVVNLERRRLELQENISRLQNSLRHWQTWEAEYEGLKEDISRLGDNYTRAQLVRRR